MQFENAENWRQLLGMIIKDTRLKQRIIEELGIQAITLNRWVSGETDPRPQNIKYLLNVLPEYREMLGDLLSDEYPDLAISPPEGATEDIPAEFYARVFAARANTKGPLRHWSMTNLIIQQAIGQLDPDRLGMAITVVRCMRSSRHPKIYSLRETVGYGTPPWVGNLEQKGMFLGAESLAGYSVTALRPVENNDIRDKHNPLPAHQVEGELSAAAHPIMYSGRVAGCMLVSSTQLHYFLSQYRLSLIHQYANLLALAFDPEDFYDPSEIELQMMPSHTIQKEHFANFRNRVTAIMAQGGITNAQAEQEVWEELEEELLRLEASAKLK